MQRYLLNIGYIGTRYNGVSKNKNQKDIHAIEDVLRQAIERIKSIKNVNIYLSSRTDAGVHATNSTCHIDLDKKIPPHVITKQVNATMLAWREQIQISKTTPVRNDFDSRYEAICRTYLYRFAVAKSRVPQGMKRHIFVNSMFIPIEESYRCYFALNNGFDLERMKAAAKQLEGFHDYRSFMKASKEQRTLNPRFCHRSMESIEVRPGTTLATSINLEKSLAHFDFYNIEFKSRAYFYRQIRNMVGALIAAGNGILNERDIYELLTIPSNHSSHKIQPAPCYGLYLTNVEYPADAIANNIEVLNEEFDDGKVLNTNEIDLENIEEKQILRE